LNSTRKYGVQLGLRFVKRLLFKLALHCAVSRQIFAHSRAVGQGIARVVLQAWVFVECELIDYSRLIVLCLRLGGGGILAWSAELS
jgi:hypothetical protein